MRYPEALALKTAPQELAYTRQDAILYALSLGVGLEGLDASDLRFVYEKALLALPTMATNFLGKNSTMIEDAGIDFRMMVQSEQRLRLHKPLPPEGRLITQGRLAHVTDKGADKGAIIDLEYTLTEADGGAPVATMTLAFLCRGDGGCGAPRESAVPPHDVPDRMPDKESALRSMPGQAALYRLSIGETNPLHIDPEVARQVGFERPILHGMCTYGFACRAVMRDWCGNDPARIASFDARFAAPFLPGETLVTRSWRDGDVVSFECLAAESGKTVLRNGRCELRN